MPVDEIMAEMMLCLLAMEKDGQEREEKEQLSLRVGSEGLTVVKNGRDELVRIEGRAISEVTCKWFSLWDKEEELMSGEDHAGRITLEEGRGQRQECMLRIRTTSYRRFSKSFLEPATITLDLGPLETSEPSFVLLRKSVREWHKKYSFPISAKECVRSSPSCQFVLTLSQLYHTAPSSPIGSLPAHLASLLQLLRLDARAPPSATPTLP